MLRKTTIIHQQIRFSFLLRAARQQLTPFPFHKSRLPHCLHFENGPNMKICGDPFADPIWIPTLDSCSIDCDKNTEYCVENEELKQQCKKMPEECQQLLQEKRMVLLKRSRFVLKRGRSSAAYTS
ncbi:hypothetical protein DICVIV_06984 [Dictyocaulus viviparus]|uniref:Uncharacterized protein n=1 Tax=Dictyocaulus viviparus TaxID=29172 RepID=A0A0D8XT20_DICVI|nr:hypothetical protein DICVIV_06984 [Dictyocaulus viviparus]